jgi:hypothetical protein
MPQSGYPVLGFFTKKRNFKAAIIIDLRKAFYIHAQNHPVQSIILCRSKR